MTEVMHALLQVKLRSQFLYFLLRLLQSETFQLGEEQNVLFDSEIFEQHIMLRTDSHLFKNQKYI